MIEDTYSKHNNSRLAPIDIASERCDIEQSSQVKDPSSSYFRALLNTSTCGANQSKRCHNMSEGFSGTWEGLSRTAVRTGQSQVQAARSREGASSTKAQQALADMREQGEARSPSPLSCDQRSLWTVRSSTGGVVRTLSSATATTFS